MSVAGGKFTCVDACAPGEFVVDGNRCNATCGGYIDAQNGSVCVDSCASGYFAQTGAGRKCVDACAAQEGWVSAEL